MGESEGARGSVVGDAGESLSSGSDELGNGAPNSGRSNRGLHLQVGVRVRARKFLVLNSALPRRAPNAFANGALKFGSRFAQWGRIVAGL